MPRESNQVNRSPADLLKYPRFDERKIAFRWSKDWWDGPINGSITYEGLFYWFDFYCDTEEPGNPYYYLAFPLSNQEAAAADSWSAENERLLLEWRPLGNDPQTRDLPSTQNIAAKWKEHEALLPNYSQREPVGWFVSGSNSSFYGVQLS